MDRKTLDLIKNCKSKEEVDRILKSNGMTEMSQKELETIAGGGCGSNDYPPESVLAGDTRENVYESEVSEDFIHGRDLGI